MDSFLRFLNYIAIQTTIALFIQVLVLEQSDEIFTTLGIVVLYKLILQIWRRIVGRIYVDNLLQADKAIVEKSLIVGALLFSQLLQKIVKRVSKLLIDVLNYARSIIIGHGKSDGATGLLQVLLGLAPRLEVSLDGRVIVLHGELKLFFKVGGLIELGVFVQVWSLNRHYLGKSVKHGICTARLKFICRSARYLLSQDCCLRLHRRYVLV